MIIFDTSLWIDHLRSPSPRLTDELGRGSVAGHAWVTGELALGGVHGDTLELLQLLPQATVASTEELLAFIDDAALTRTGIGWVDAQLLASARLTPAARLATADRKLAAQAERLGVAAQR